MTCCQAGDDQIVMVTAEIENRLSASVCFKYNKLLIVMLINSGFIV